MKKIVFLLLTGIVVILTVMGIRSSIKRAETSVPTIEDVQKREGIPVVTAQAERRDLYQVRSFTGTVKGSEQADATPARMTLEKIEEIRVSLGDRVRKGDVVATLDRQNPNTRYRQARDARDEAERDLERSADLLKAGAISQQVYDKTVLAAKIARADYEAVLATLEVRAPVNGTVTDIFLEEGEAVSPGAPILRIARLDRVTVEIEVGETDIALVKKGQQALITTSSFPDSSFKGAVSEIALSTNPRARNFTIKIDAPNPDYRLKPGMFAKVDLFVGSVSGVIAVPTDAVVHEDGKSFVYTLDSEMTAKKSPVSTGLENGEWVEITEGLAAGDAVVVEGQNRLSDGSKVLIVSEGE